MKNKTWISFFSQTGSEICRISEKINRWPDIICTNKNLSHIDDINPELLNNCFDKLIFVKASPSIEEYKTVLSQIKENYIITLHGWLRIVPPEICNEYSMYNGHPGNIIKYPESLKGYNPQERAFNLGIRDTGSVIHRVSPEVDGGEIVAFKECYIDLNSLKKTYYQLHNNSIDLWVEFLEKKLIINE